MIKINDKVSWIKSSKRGNNLSLTQKTGTIIEINDGLAKVKPDGNGRTIFLQLTDLQLAGQGDGLLTKFVKDVAAQTKASFDIMPKVLLESNQRFLARKWISVSTQLPPNCVEVLVFCNGHAKDVDDYKGRNGGLWGVTKGYYDHNEEQWYPKDYHPITHWMPLPAPPAEAANADE